MVANAEIERVVAIGASAGGLEVLQSLVDLLPADAGYIYLIPCALST